MSINNPFKKSTPEAQEEIKEKIFVDPATDGWARNKGVWTRHTNSGVEYLGLTSSGEAMTQEEIQALYNRKEKLESLIAGGKKDNQVKGELALMNKRIEYLERYGPEVMGGIK